MVAGGGRRRSRVGSDCSALWSVRCKPIPLPQNGMADEIDRRGVVVAGGVGGRVCSSALACGSGMVPQTTPTKSRLLLWSVLSIDGVGSRPYCPFTGICLSPPGSNSSSKSASHPFPSCPLTCHPLTLSPPIFCSREGMRAVRRTLEPSSASTTRWGCGRRLLPWLPKCCKAGSSRCVTDWEQGKRAMFMFFVRGGAEAR